MVQHNANNTPDYFIYTKTSGCIYCDKAKELLDAHDLTYSETSFDSLKYLRDRVCPMISPDVVTSFPLILRGDTRGVVGGYTHLRDIIEEPVLNGSLMRYAAFPVKEFDIFKLYKQSVACFWTSEEISMRDDVSVYENQLTDQERHFVSHILAFFSQADAIVLQNLMENFQNEVKLAESNMFYSMQGFMESEHSIVYSMLIDSLIRDPVERTKLFDAITHIPAVRAKANWALKWFSKTNRFATRLVAFACVEGILFSGSFCAIYWLKQRATMPGLSLSNQFISRDEKLHTEHAVALYQRLIHPLSEEDVHTIVKEAVENEKAFIIDALPCSLIGMNSVSMSEYIEFVADSLCMDLGYRPIYGSQNPFPFMEHLGLDGKTNFFESRTGDYARAGVTIGGGDIDHQSLSDDMDTLSNDDDF